MPEYFNLSFQFERKDIYKTFVKDFYTVLEQAGIKFKSGCWGSEHNTLEEICACNQRKLEENFKLGFTQHYSYNFKQVLFDFKTYSHVRGFWVNQYPEQQTFSFEIVIPESEILVKELWEEGKVLFQKEKIETLIEVAKEIWKFPYIRTIQTGLEGFDASTGITALLEGNLPNVTPFSIIQEKYRSERCQMENIEVEKIFREGILLTSRKDF